MDYEKMTDFEINRAVGLASGAAEASVPLFDMVLRNIDGERFDPCNDPADAWPIIDENNITIINDNPSRRVAVSSASSAFYNGTDAVMAADANGLRAAMIVFLKMMDAGNE